MENVCNFCSKIFINSGNLTRHQLTSKSCLALQGKNESIECINCKKILSLLSYKRHKVKCDKEYEEKNKPHDTLLEKYSLLRKTIKN